MIWPIKVFEEIENTYFQYGIGALCFKSHGSYLIIPFKNGSICPLFLDKRWKWDEETKSFIREEKDKVASIGSTEYHAHFVVKDGFLTQTEVTNV